jgi:hypothetical protein
MQLNKEKQAIIMVIVVVIAMALFAILVKQSIDGNKVVKQAPQINQSVQNREIDKQVKENGEDINSTLDERQQEMKNNVREGEKGWYIYNNVNYNLEIAYPVNWFFFDCSSIRKELSIHISDSKNFSDCNNRDQRIDIRESANDISYKVYELLEGKEYKENYIDINGLEAKQISYYYELRGPEGEIYNSKPQQKVILTSIPYKNQYIIISYSELFRYDGEPDIENFPIEENFEDIYNKVVNSFKFID